MEVRMDEYLEELSQKFSEEGLKRLKEIKSKGVHEFIEKFLKILNPKKFMYPLERKKTRNT